MLRYRRKPVVGAAIGRPPVASGCVSRTSDARPYDSNVVREKKGTARSLPTAFACGQKAAVRRKTHGSFLLMKQLLGLVSGLKADVDAQLFEQVRIHVGQNHRGVGLTAFELVQLLNGAAGHGVGD